MTEADRERPAHERARREQQFPAGVHEKLTGQALAEVAAGRMRPVIGQSYPLDRAADAHRGLEGRSAIGKTLLTVDGTAA
ncbi:MAG TPA: zinc-binding dehydrogenase [Streptosporangiaceae bacterium]|jgi:NADPH2:quinone reductase